MTTHKASRAWPAVAGAVILVLCSLTGLGAGELARVIVSASGIAGFTSAVVVSRTDTGHLAPSPSPSPTGRPASPSDSAFTLTAVVRPTQVAPGQSMMIVATVVGRDGVSPVLGQQCFLRAPSDGVSGLVTDWPGPEVTDSQGHAEWNLTVPSVQPGRYAVEVIAFGRDQYSYHWDALVTVVSGG